MERFLTSNFVHMMEKLKELEQNLYEHSKEFPLGTEISDEHDKHIRVFMPVVRNHCNTLKMKDWIDEPIIRISHVLSRINGHARDVGGRSYTAVQYEIKALRQSIDHSLQSRLFLYLPSEDAAYYNQDDLFGVKERFSKANEEIKAAGNCYATGNYTACVFHLMRAVEVGARKMVLAMNARKHLSKPVELCEWGELVTALEEGLKALRIGHSKNVNKKATYEFYNHAVAQFRNFKDAWRNNISHKRTTYLAGQTKDIMDNTRQFMQHLAQRLKE
jgi:hypothetical protein